MHSPINTLRSKTLADDEPMSMPKLFMLRFLMRIGGFGEHSFLSLDRYRFFDGVSLCDCLRQRLAPADSDKHFARSDDALSVRVDESQVRSLGGRKSPAGSALRGSVPRLNPLSERDGDLFRRIPGS